MCTLGDLFYVNSLVKPERRLTEENNVHIPCNSVIRKFYYKHDRNKMCN